MVQRRGGGGGVIHYAWLAPAVDALMRRDPASAPKPSTWAGAMAEAQGMGRVASTPPNEPAWLVYAVAFVVGLAVTAAVLAW